MLKLNYEIIRSKLLKILLVIFILGALVISLFYSYQYFINRPVKVTNYESLSLDMTMDEVMYNMGYPKNVLYEDLSNNHPEIKDTILITANQKQISENKNSVRGFFYWDYDFENKRIDIEFDKNNSKIKSIGCYVNPEKFVNVKTCFVNGIQSLDKEEFIINHLGKPDKEVIDGVTKTIVYSNYNMKINLVKRTAYYIKIEVN